MPDEAKRAFKRPSRAPRRMINKEADGQARCILITHKDERRYNGNIRSGGGGGGGGGGDAHPGSDSVRSSVNILHLHAWKDTQTQKILSRPSDSTNTGMWETQKEPFGGLFWRGSLEWIGGVGEKKKSAHQVAFCNTHKASALMTFHASELGSENKSY